MFILFVTALNFLAVGAVPVPDLEEQRRANLPIWPVDFKWSLARKPSNYECVQIHEYRDPNTWDDNYFCWRHGKTNPGIKWSSSWPIAGMECVHITEPSEPSSHTWKDNFLCKPPNSPYDFRWSSEGQIPGKSCIRWLENSDPHSWDNNYLCATHGAGGSIPHVPQDPVWPSDFKWSMDKIPEGYDCIQIYESSEPRETMWHDNYFCWKEGTKDPGMRWNTNGTIPGMRCTQITEPWDEHSWEDNYLCVPMNSSLNFVWSHHRAIKDHSCIQWIENSDRKAGWNDNYLCLERCPLKKVEIIEPEQYEPVYEGTQVIGSVSGAACLAAAGNKNELRMESFDSVEETTSLTLTKTDEVNWSASTSIQVEASAKILGVGMSVTVGAGFSAGERHSWSRAEGRNFGKGTSVGVGQWSTYSTPGGAVMFGEVARYTFDRSNLPAKMHFECPISGPYVKESTVDLQSTSYQSADFETMTGTFTQEACNADHSIVECVKRIDDEYRKFFGDMNVVREAFKQCFDGNGQIGNYN